MTPLVEMRDIDVAFGGRKAVDPVTVDLFLGEVVGPLGHDGAGKSTLVQVFSGARHAGGGEIRIDGQRAGFRSPRDARRWSVERRLQ